jgi:hypothetical protein
MNEKRIYKHPDRSTRAAIYIVHTRTDFLLLFGNGRFGYALRAPHGGQAIICIDVRLLGLLGILLRQGVGGPGLIRRGLGGAQLALRLRFTGDRRTQLLLGRINARFGTRRRRFGFGDDGGGFD